MLEQALAQRGAELAIQRFQAQAALHREDDVKQQAQDLQASLQEETVGGGNQPSSAAMVERERLRREFKAVGVASIARERELLKETSATAALCRELADQAARGERLQQEAIDAMRRSAMAASMLQLPPAGLIVAKQWRHWQAASV